MASFSCHFWNFLEYFLCVRPIMKKTQKHSTNAIWAHVVKEDHPSLHSCQSATNSYFAKLMNGGVRK